MNVRKPADYSALYAALDRLITAAPPQMELYCEIGRLVCGCSGKGAAVAAAEYLCAAHPDVPGFSPRNLHRMRDFYCAYEDAPEVMAEAMAIGWTQNVVILEAELTVQEKAWYIRAVQQFGWSKLKLAERIASSAHLEATLDLMGEMCHTQESTVGDSKPDLSPVMLQIGREGREHLSKRVEAEIASKKQDLPFGCEREVLSLSSRDKMECQQHRCIYHRHRHRVASTFGDQLGVRPEDRCGQRTPPRFSWCRPAAASHDASRNGVPPVPPRRPRSPT